MEDTTKKLLLEAFEHLSKGADLLQEAGFLDTSALLYTIVNDSLQDIKNKDYKIDAAIYDATLQSIFEMKI